MTAKNIIDRVMKMEQSVYKIICSIEDKIFRFDNKEAMSEYIKLNEEIKKIATGLDDKKLQGLMKVLNLMNTALENKDYLLLVDLLRYELVNVLSNETYLTQERM